MNKNQKKFITPKKLKKNLRISVERGKVLGFRAFDWQPATKSQNGRGWKGPLWVI